MIKCKQISLRESTLKDRRMVYDWYCNSDVAPIIHLSGGGDQTFQQFCDDDWKPYFFTGESPRQGRLFIILHKGLPVGAIGYNDIDSKNRVELDIWLSSEANCGNGFGSDAIDTLCKYLVSQFGVNTFMMQPSARNPRAIRAYEKVGFLATPASPEEIESEWGGVDDQKDHTTRQLT